MSQQNVEIVKRATDALNRRDVDAYGELITADYELLPAMTGFTGVSFRGREGMERYFEELADTWEEFSVLAEDFRELDGECMLVLVRLEGRGKGSGIPIDALHTVLFHFRGGRISRIHSYLDRGEALRAAGLSE
jgi:ketosteroid isomerase-like protein